ncbi:MAG: ArsB/NhaD family transporter, partial [Eggerthellaceae bacterium]|nr:ArsB/NhaD family transporter [Eggerthellaceae bacterium]
MELIAEEVAHWQVIVAAIIFLVSYAFIISEKIDRSIIALTGALLMLLFGIVDFHDSYTQHIHWETLFLLLGMMMLVGIARKSGIFQYIALKTAQSAKGDPKKILVRLALLTAVGSAFIDNVTMVLLIVPITISIANILHIKPTPYLITQILICNIGGAATLVGDPPNIMIGTAAGISFNQFLFHITPIIVILLLLTILYLRFYYSNRLKTDEAHKSKLMETEARTLIRDSALAKKSIVVFSLTLLGFLSHKYVDIEPAMVALLGATLLMILSTKSISMEEIFHSVEWVTIFFFAGLFVLVGGLVDAGIIPQLASWMIHLTGNDVTLTAFILLWGAGIASAFVDNIPLVATMIPLVSDLSAQAGMSGVETMTLWWSLSLGACLGGNGTLIASSA